MDSSAGGEKEQRIGDFIEDARIDIQPEQVMERQEISRLMNSISARSYLGSILRRISFETPLGRRDGSFRFYTHYGNKYIPERRTNS